ncbi:MAG: hypothetical protein H6Q89_3553, partial [Myxococcaceae bacterium]|nr:hypothetical protein [Myxococcaceae bacterium]
MIALILTVLAGTPSLSLTASVDGGKPKAGWVYARAGQKVVLQAAVTGAKAKSWRWFKLEVASESVDNTQPKFHFEPIAFRAVELEGCRDQSACAADVTPSVLAKVEQLPGVGTMAFQVKATLEQGAELGTPGLEAVKYGGLKPEVMRVTFRRDDSYLGYVSELVNTPYIFGSAGPDGRNQSDLLIGADCADLAVYGRRRMGKKTEYTSSYAIDKQAPERFRGVAANDEGRVIDAAGKIIAFGDKGVRAGDL